MLLFGEDAPEGADVFARLADSSLRDRRGRLASYRYATVSRILPARIELGRSAAVSTLVDQQPGRPQRLPQRVQLPSVADDNRIAHDRRGLVSVKRGGSFEFSILLTPDRSLDDEFMVIGVVEEGFDVIDALARVSTNKPTVPDGYRAVGRLIGDSRAKLDVSSLLPFFSTQPLLTAFPTSFSSIASRRTATRQGKFAQRSP